MPELNKYTKEEYEIQHFGFSSSDFITQFRTIVQNRITEIYLDAEESIVKRMPLNEEQKEELKCETKEIIKYHISKMNDILNKNKFNDVTAEFFNIPHNVSLPKDNIHNTHAEKKDYDELFKEIEDLQNKYKRQKLLLECYNNELEFIEKLKPLQKIAKTIETTVAKLPNPTNHVKQIKKYQEKISKMDELLDPIQDNLQDNDGSALTMNTASIIKNNIKLKQKKLIWSL